MATKIPVSLLKNPVHFLSVGLGSGLATKAPGTFGTLAALPFWFLLQYLSPANYIIALLIAFAAGVYFCGETAKALGVHDHGGIVWDEFVGLWIALFLVPPNIFWVALHGGLGIMIDDVLAGVYAFLVLQLCFVLS